jgi:hypothetical protein
MLLRNVALTVVAVTLFSGAGFSAFAEAFRNAEIGPVEKIQSITAGPDGTAWGLTSSGRLFFCKSVAVPETHIACYDEKGPIKANFQR